MTQRSGKFEVRGLHDYLEHTGNQQLLPKKFFCLFISIFITNIIFISLKDDLISHKTMLEFELLTFGRTVHILKIYFRNCLNQCSFLFTRIYIQKTKEGNTQKQN